MLTATRIFAPVELQQEQRPDGTLILTNRLTPADIGEPLTHRLELWARTSPMRPFLSALSPDGGRTVLTYGEAFERVQAIAARLLTLPLSARRPLMIVGANGIHHALVLLAAMRVGIPSAIVSPAYCSPSAAPWAKLRRVVEQISPGFVLADDPAGFGRATSGFDLPEAAIGNLLDLDWLMKLPTADGAALRAAVEAVTPDTPAKLLFTSGSTGSPKAVINTHRMMMSNMQALELVWPFLRERPPVLVDWLPWNHTFGGNACFNLALYFGGTFHIDAGKPVPALIGRTVEALRELPPTLYFNVPAGYEALLPHLEADTAFAAKFLSGLDFLFNAGAALPASTRERIEALALRAIGRVPPIVGGWGSTETAPFSTVIYFSTEHAANLGVPLPGTAIKLAPYGDRAELRVRGPNVMPGYWGEPEATAAAFDEEGFYRMGDAGKLADPGRPEAGLIFDGRISENFKLMSGTWVNVGALRLSVIAACDTLVSDLVVTGEGQQDIGLLIFPCIAACRAFIGDDAADGEALASDPRLRARLADLLRVYNRMQSGGSTRVSRFAIMAEPPSPQHDEITDKGYIAQRAILKRRAAEVEALHARTADL